MCIDNFNSAGKFQHVLTVFGGGKVMAENKQRKKRINQPCKNIDKKYLSTKHLTQILFPKRCIK